MAQIKSVSQNNRNVLTIKDLQEKASRALPSSIRDYFNEGSLDMLTLRDNEEAFNRYKLQPRVMRDVSKIDTSTFIFGTKVDMPLGFSPTAMHQLVHPDGEIATSRVAAKYNIPMILSCYSTKSLEDVIAKSKGNPYMMHICFFKDRRKTLKIVKRAEGLTVPMNIQYLFVLTALEAAGCKALFLSVDVPVHGIRLFEHRNHFKLPDIALPMLEDENDTITTYHSANQEFDPNLTWEDGIQWLRNQTRMEIWLKGITTANDVELAIKHGVDGVMISNHGGRQLDGMPASLDVLRNCAPLLDQIRIVIDGGIRRGSDIFKALALGANFCFVGRVPLWGLAYNGDEGVSLAINILQKEFETTMALCGCKSIQEISKDHLAVLDPTGLLCRL